EPQHCLSGQPTTRQPHTTPSARAPTVRGLSQLTMGWNDATATYENDLPAGTDASGYAVLQFRAAVNFTDPRNVAGAPQDFVITVTDGKGGSASTTVSASSANLYYPQGSAVTTNPVPKVILNTIRIPTAAFAGVDLTNVQSIVFQLAAPA